MKRKLKKISGASRLYLPLSNMGTGRRSELFKGCTEFEITVYRCTMKIPAGETRSYSWVAQRIGQPKAARAVAQALKRNPWPLIIPCHRVIASDGNIGGYAYGVSLKRLLLSLERKSFRHHLF